MLISLLLVFFIPTVLAIDSIPVELDFHFIEKPLLNKSSELQLEFTALQDIEDVHARISLIDLETEEPLFQVFELVEGELEWFGNVKKGEKIILKAKLIAKNVGYYKIRADVDAVGFIGKSNRRFPRVLRVDPSLAKGEIENGWKSSCGFGSDIYDEQIDADLDIVFTKLPELNEEVGIIATITPHENLSDYRFNIILPRKGFEVIKAESNRKQKGPFGTATITGSEGCPIFVYWDGILNKDETLEIKIHAKIINPGWGTLIFRTSKTVNKNGIYITKGIREKLDIIVDKEFSEIGGDVCQSDNCINYQSTIIPETKWQGFKKAMKKGLFKFLKMFIGG